MMKEKNTNNLLTKHDIYQIVENLNSLNPFTIEGMKEYFKEMLNIEIYSIDVIDEGNDYVSIIVDNGLLEVKVDTMYSMVEYSVYNVDSIYNRYLEKN